MSEHVINSLLQLKQQLSKANEDDYERSDVQNFGSPEEDVAKEKSQEEDVSQAPQKVGKRKTKSNYTDWAPREDYTDEENDEISRFIEMGFYPREAEFLAGAHRGPMDLQSALRSTVRAGDMSPKAWEILKPAIGQWLADAREYKQKHADVKKNAHGALAGMLKGAFKDHTEEYRNAYHDFLESEDLKNMSPREQYKAAREWKDNWHSQNPNYAEGFAGLSEKAKAHSEEVNRIKKETMQDKIDRLLSLGGTPEGAVGSVAQAAKQLGMEPKEEGPPQVNLKQDPMAALARQFPELVEKLRGKASPEQMDRLKRRTSAKTNKPKIVRRRPAGNKPPTDGGEGAPPAGTPGGEGA